VFGAKMDKTPDKMMFPGDTGGDADEKGQGKKDKRSLRRRRSSVKVFAARQRETRDGHAASEIILFCFILFYFVILLFYIYIILLF
jgi:hypothetical protein